MGGGGLRRFLVLGLALLAGPVAALTPAEVERRLGHSGGRPGTTEQLTDQVMLRATLLHDGGELGDWAKAGEALRLVLSFDAGLDGVDEPVRLRCVVRFVASDGSYSTAVRDEICYEGRFMELTPVGIAGSVTFGTPLRFRPQSRDAKGTYGVEVVISDLNTGASVVMMPTYDWLGGRE